MKPLLTALLAVAAMPCWAQTIEVLNHDVTQETIDQTICVRGYAKSVRPSVNYTNGVKAKLMREQGIDWSLAHDYELDHIVSLELGGNPRNIHNLQLQPWDGPDGAHAKDKLENKLHRMVCRRQITLSEAQACIWKDWQACGFAAQQHTRGV